MRIPGLRFVPHFFTPAAQAKLVQESLALHQKIRALAPTAKAHTSKHHNLTSQRVYKLLTWPEQSRKINAQHFERYGDDGHQLTYFIDNGNVPEFIQKDVIARIEELEEIRALLGNLNWRFTFNTYRAATQDALSGFPFHTDIAPNGDITTITTLLSEAEFEMKRPEDETTTLSLRLIPGSVLLLSGEARWKWLHRVVPQPITATDNLEAIRRISLVLGCRALN